MSQPSAMLDFVPATETLLEDVVDGLSSSPKTLPCKYFYDQKGSQLFDQICELEEYYPTRTELAIMERYVGEMAEILGPRCLLIEYGSGSSIKTEILLAALEDPAGYVPIDISREHLQESAKRVARRFPQIEVLPVAADYTVGYELPTTRLEPRKKVVYFPGSTLGNFDRPQARDFLRRTGKVCDGILLGVDLHKAREILEPAYDDALGVTAAFNLNLLTRINRELGADFDLDAFRHRAFYNEDEHRIEMHIESLRPQTVNVDGRAFSFERGETICTEYSNKYSLEEMREMARQAGLRVERVWTDDRDLFSVQYLVPA